MKKKGFLSQLKDVGAMVIVVAGVVAVCTLVGLPVPSSVIEQANEFKHLI
jgi:hypothetical protein